MLIDVLTRVASDAGYHPTQQRTKLIKILSDAAKDLHKILECDKIYRECTLVVPPNKVVSLPSFIGEVRGTRMTTIDTPFDVNSMSAPRYVSGTWQYKIKNWRDLGDSPAHTNLPGVLPLYLYADVIETPNIQVTISGQTASALRDEEIVTLDSSPKQTTKNFGLAIYSISCNTLRSCNIKVKDVDGNEYAILYNTDNYSRYKLIDVSQVFWSADTTDGQTMIDILFKVPVTELTRDTDLFYGGNDYDNAWYYQSMYNYARTMQGREADAARYKAEALGCLIQDKGSEDEGKLKKISFGRNKFFSLFRQRNDYYAASDCCGNRPG